MAKQLVWGAVLSAVLLLLCLRFKRSLDDRLIASLAEPSRLVVQSSSPKSSSKPTPTLDQSPHHAFLRKLGVDDHDGDGDDVHNGKVLYVHIVPHTHDDVGWRKTVEQYYYGLNNSIDTRGSVHSIITTAVESLLDDPARTFTYVEMKFLSMWWKSQSDQMKDNVRYLIANKQLSIVNGGWCMHDEAAPHYIGMIDQTSLGHEFLTRELGVIPKVGWQLDPFGHSATQASLMSRGMGFDALYFGRIDYQDLRLRQLTRQCEGLWNASRESSDIALPIFWGLTGSYGGNYGAPRGYCFDVLCQDEPLVGANETRLRERLRTFLEDVRIQSDRTQGDHVMVTMGEDFNYIQAHLNFANMDLLINSIMSYQHWKILDIPSIFGPQYDRVDIFYSTPDYYTEMKYKETVRVRNRPRTMQRGTSNSAVGQQGQHVSESPVWVVKTDDFFPYSDCEHCFWTGYFTSRASFKRFERVSSSFLLAARQIEALWSGQSNSTGQGMESRPLFALEDALGIAQHHDAVSGTAKQHVADDYSFKLQTGLDLASKFVAKTLKNTLISDSGLLENLTFCHQLNESICDLSQDATKSLGKDLYVVVYNAKASEVSSIIRLPVSTNQTYLVERVERNATVARSRLVETVQAVNLRTTDKPRYTVMFDTGPLPPIGVALFRVSMTNKVFSSSLRSNDLTETRLLFRAADGKDVVVSNELLSVTFDSSTGMMKQVFSQNVSLLLTQEWGYYTSFDSDYDRTEVPSSRADQNSGAYVFRPSTPEEKLKLMNASPSGAKFVDTSVGTEVHVAFDAPWIRQVTRILKGQPYVEIEYTIGPIPIDDGRGREIVNRYITPIKSEGKVYTDSNGREFLERRRNYRPSWSLEVYEQVAGNYYPINAAAYIEDSDAALSVVVDRSQGGGSIIDGTLEFMVQRRTVADDFRGVDEPLNETCGGMEPYPPYGDAKRVGDGVVIRGVHRLLVGAKGAGLARSQMDATFAEPLIFVASSPKPSTPVGALVATQSSLSALQLSLPSNVMLITLMRLQDRERPTWLLRLGHQYAAGEHEVLSQPAKVNLATFLVDWDVSKIEEKTLSGNRDWDVYTKERYDWTGELDASETTDAPIDSIVVLQPMQIRTFEITVTAKT